MWVKEFKPLANSQGIIKGLVRHARLFETPDEEDEDTGRQTDSAGKGVAVYDKGRPVDLFTLVISGKITVLAGAEGFESELGPWSCIANRALGPDVYIPDFSAIAYGACRLLQVAQLDHAEVTRRLRQAHEGGRTTTADRADDSKSNGDGARRGGSWGVGDPPAGPETHARTFPAAPVARPSQQQNGDSMRVGNGSLQLVPVPPRIRTMRPSQSSGDMAASYSLVVNGSPTTTPAASERCS
eukprot:jgi/Mesvir1/15217/Mv06447-RA.1